MNKTAITSSLCTFTIAAMLSACSAPQQKPMTAEEAARVKAVQEAFLARLKGQVPAQPQQALVETPLVTKDAFQADIAAVKAAGKAGKVVIQSNQLMVDGKPYLDAEGSVQKFSSDVMTGDFTYLIQTATNSAVLKFNRSGSSMAGVKVATVSPGPEGLIVKTVTGESFSGNTVVPTANGFIVARANAVFQYNVDQSQKSFAIRNGFHLARFQQGDVAGTGYVLLEKDEEQTSSGGLLSGLQGLGSTLGISKAYDYVLVNLESGKEIPLNLPSGTKNVAVYSNCQKQNAYVNKCADMDSVESLYERDGRPNYSHYYWSVNWFKTSAGIVAVYKESTKVKAINMDEGKVFTLFSRTLGVNSLDTDRDSEGKVSVSAKLGFSSDTISDLNAFMLANDGTAEMLAAE